MDKWYQKGQQNEKGKQPSKGKVVIHKSKHKSHDKTLELQPPTSTTSFSSQKTPTTTRLVKENTKTRTVAKNKVTYTARPIVPAEKAELVSVARAMHRSKFDNNLRQLFDLEKEAALEAIRNDFYISWRCPENTWDCIRLSQNSRCFCDHALKDHANSRKLKQLKTCTKCRCADFNFVPERPEDVGEFWLRKRANFDALAWRAKCRCEHEHTAHEPNRAKRCSRCTCPAFASRFLCAACDTRWESHVTCFEDGRTRARHGLPAGREYIPFHEMPDLQSIILTDGENHSAACKAIEDYDEYSIPPTGKNKLNF